MVRKYKEFFINPAKIKTHKVNLKKVYNYAKLLEQGTKFPIVKVYKSSSSFFHPSILKTNNGAHRIMAHRLLGWLIKVKMAIR